MHENKSSFEMKLMEKILKVFFVLMLNSLADIDSEVTSQLLKYFK